MKKVLNDKERVTLVSTIAGQFMAAHFLKTGLHEMSIKDHDVIMDAAIETAMDLVEVVIGPDLHE